MIIVYAWSLKWFNLRSAVLSCSVCKGEGLKCYTCVAKNMEECNQQGSTVCPAHSDACSTITGPSEYTHTHGDCCCSSLTGHMRETSLLTISVACFNLT